VSNCFQQKTSNISETGLYRTEVLPSSTFTNEKLHACVRLVPKSTNLDYLERLLHAVFQNTCVFRSPPQKFELLRHRTVSLRQHGVLVIRVMTGTSCVTV